MASPSERGEVQNVACPVSLWSFFVRKALKRDSLAILKTWLAHTSKVIFKLQTSLFSTRSSSMMPPESQQKRLASRFCGTQFVIGPPGVTAWQQLLGTRHLESNRPKSTNSSSNLPLKTKTQPTRQTNKQSINWPNKQSSPLANWIFAHFICAYRYHDSPENPCFIFFSAPFRYWHKKRRFKHPNRAQDLKATPPQLPRGSIRPPLAASSPWPGVPAPKPGEFGTAAVYEKIYMGVSQNRVKPQNRWFMMENLVKMDDLGVPLFSETSTCGLFSVRFRASNHSRHGASGGPSCNLQFRDIYICQTVESISCCEFHRILILKQKEFRKIAPARSLHQFVGWLCLKSFDCLSPHNLDLMYDNNRQGNRWNRNEAKRSLDLRQKLTHSRSFQVWCDPKKALVNSWHFQDKLVAWFAQIFSESLTFLALREPLKVFHEFLAG